jgi:hypothetical protein
MDQPALACVRFVLDHFRVQAEEDEEAGIVGPAIPLCASASGCVLPVSA